MLMTAEPHCPPLMIFGMNGVNLELCGLRAVPVPRRVHVKPWKNKHSSLTSWVSLRSVVMEAKFTISCWMFIFHFCICRPHEARATDSYATNGPSRSPRKRKRNSTSATEDARHGGKGKGRENWSSPIWIPIGNPWLSSLSKNYYYG